MGPGSSQAHALSRVGDSAEPAGSRHSELSGLLHGLPSGSGKAQMGGWQALPQAIWV
jgi:hypothetical protein